MFFGGWRVDIFSRGVGIFRGGGGVIEIQFDCLRLFQ